MSSKSLCTKLHWSIPVWISVIFMITGWILNLVSFAAPFWNRQKPVCWGLWQMCTETEGCEIISNEFLTDIMRVGRVFLTTAFISYTIMIILVVLYLFWRSNLNLLAAASGTSFFTLVGLFLGAILWISSTNTSLSWCYYLCYASAFLVAASGGVILHVRRQERLRLIDLQEQQGEL